ncbi:MAG TPA: RNA polymerase sigma factor [Solirubrobacteraceae bacterium]
MDHEAEHGTLVQLAANGDEVAFARLYRRYEKDVWDLSFYMCARNHADARDAVQETFLNAWRALSRYTGKGTFKSWLLSICRNVCIDRMRRAPRATVHLDALSDSAPSDEAGTADGRRDQLDRIALSWALGELARDEREAWLLIDVLGYKSGEAARIAGVRAATTMRSRVVRARAQIAAALRADPYQPPTESGGVEIWGLYHSAVERAIVAALVQRHPSATVGRGRRAAFDGPRGAVRVTTNGAGVVPTPFTWCDGQPRFAAPPWDGCSAADFDLVRFFDRLEAQIPTTARIIAVVNSPGIAEADTWLAHRPRWQLLRATTESSWLTHGERLLMHCTPCPSTDGAGRVLALLHAAEPFIWTYGHDRRPT